MANIAYELALRFGTVVWLRAESRKHAWGTPERTIAEERMRPMQGLELPAGRPVYWLHAVSMGEVGVAKVLIRELKAQAPDSLAVLSTSTASGFEAAQKIAEADAVVSARFDLRSLVSTMFDAIHPAAIILVEGDLWRNMLALARRRGVPVFVANAKMSPKSLRTYHKFPLYTRSLFSRLARVYTQTELYRERFLEAGLPDAFCEVIGNVKLDMDAPAVAGQELADIARTAGCADRSPIVTFGSLHPGEEIIALRAMERVWRAHPKAHALIAPRHIKKTPHFEESIRAEFGIEPNVYSGVKTQNRTSGARVTLVDRMGQLMKLYALGDIGVVGGTFIPGIGGHNLTEPSFYGKPALYGPYVHTQLGLHDVISAYGAGAQISPEAFPEFMAGLLDDPAEIGRLGANGKRMVEESRGVAQRIVGDVLARTAAK